MPFFLVLSFADSGKLGWFLFELCSVNRRERCNVCQNSKDITKFLTFINQQSFFPTFFLGGWGHTNYKNRSIKVEIGTLKSGYCLKSDLVKTGIRREFSKI